MLRAEKLIKIIKTAKFSNDVNEPPVWQIEKLRLQALICRIVLLPVCGTIAGLFRFMQSYRIENVAEIRREFKKIWAEKERTGKPLVICANHLTFVDSALMIWALASNFWYLFNYRAFMWNIPAGDFFKKKLHYHLTLYLSKCIFIDREGSPAHKNAILNLCRYLLAKGNVVLVFPEGQRSREGIFDVDRLRFGVGKILTSFDEAQVLCIYLRSDKQKRYSNYPPRGSRFTMKMKVIEPALDKGVKKQASIAVVKEIGKTIKAMENEFFAEKHKKDGLLPDF